MGAIIGCATDCFATKILRLVLLQALLTRVVSLLYSYDEGIRMKFFLLLSTVALAACETAGTSTISSQNSSSASISSETRNQIALCGGGMSQSTTGKLEGKLELAKRSGELSASLKDEIRAIIFADDVFETDSGKNKAYEDFLNCVKS